ncbi:MAG: tetraacyldisaccharide 4'-kinase, partial [Acidobacteriota bacterium]
MSVWWRVASWPLERVNAAAYRLFAAGIREPERAGAPVISVGNIAVGGTGKTPMVAAIARALCAAGHRPAILSRGYRRAEKRPVTSPPGQRPDWREVGDEPALLARLVPGAALSIDPDRTAGARRAVSELGATVLVLDDGFQHWRLARDLDVVVVDGRDPLCLNGPRREHPAALARVGAVVVMGGAFEQASATLRRWTPNAPLLGAAVVPTAVHVSGQSEPVSALAGRRVLAAAGIAAPGRFFRTLETLGAEVVGTRKYPDHHRLDAAEVAVLVRAAESRGALPVVTAKDAIKLPPESLQAVAWLAVEA